MPSVEKWKQIKTHPNYEVSSEGRIRNRRTGHVLSCTRTGGGYLKVNLGNGSKSTQRVNRLVAFAFLGDPPEGRIYCHHKNHDPADNRLENLEWVTPEENSTQPHTNSMETGQTCSGVWMPTSSNKGGETTSTCNSNWEI